MQESHWADLLTKAPSRTVARYQPPSPRARLEAFSTARDTSSLGSPRLASTLAPQMGTASTSGRTSSSNSDATQSDKRRGDHAGSSLVSADSHADSVAAIHTLNNTAASRLAQTQHSQVTKRGAMGRAREPQAATGQQREVSRSASHSKESLPHQSHHATAPRESKTSHIWCGNNILSPKLRRNGGNMEIGSPSQCFRKGVGAGFYQEIDPAHLGQFLADNSGPYNRYIEQPLFYGDGPVPAGKIRATLSQCRSRGFGVGAVRRAKKILKERRHGMSRA